MTDTLGSYNGCRYDVLPDDLSDTLLMNGNVLKSESVQILGIHAHQGRNSIKGSKARTGAGTLGRDNASNIGYYERKAKRSVFLLILNSTNESSL